MQNDDVRLREALRVLTEAGAVFCLPASHQRHYAVGQVAEMLDCSVSWVKRHLCEFPHAWRMPGGELRIPARDVEALAKRCVLKRAT